MTKLALLGCMVVLVFNVVNAVIPCGSQLGHDLSPLSAQSYSTVNGFYVRICGIQVGCLDNAMSCRTSDTSVGHDGVYDAPQTTWSYVDNTNPSAGLLLQTSSAPSGWRSQWRFLCAPGPLLTNITWTGHTDDSLGTMRTWEVYTNLTCGSQSTSVPSAPSSSSSAPVVPYSSTGLPGGVEPNCSSSQQRWYFSFMAMVSATHWVRFSGSFYTVVVPAGMKFMQVVSIDATWQVHMSGQSVSYWVNSLDVDSHNLINVNGFNLFPLQGQALGFYVNGQLTVIGGSNPLPTVLSWSNASILTSIFVYSQTMSDIFTGC